MKRVLFIDRDGTLIVEPLDDFQVDTLDKLEFLPGVFRNLFRIRSNLPFELAIVSNQDGLGTKMYPEENYNRVQNKLLKAFKNEGVVFDDILIDRSLPEEGLPTRKPGTALLTKYMGTGYDLANSFVIGDRITDIELAKNLGAKGILIGPEDLSNELTSAGLSDHCVLHVQNWDEIYRYLMGVNRHAEIERITEETQIKVSVSLDGEGRSDISTGLGFFDHMLDQLARHSGCDLNIRVEGDLMVDEHHSIEDTALALGEAFSKALGDKRGIGRYGFTLPMDDSQASVTMDFGGRNWFEWNADFKREKIGDVPTEMFSHFFKSFTDGVQCNLHIRAEGKNEHHKIEAIFKAVARSIKMAVAIQPGEEDVPSTKGVL